MRVNIRFVAILAILFVTRYIINVNSIKLPSFSDLKNKLLNRSNTIEYNDDSTPNSTNLADSNKEDDVKPVETSKPSFFQLFEKFTDPLTRDFPPDFRRNYAYFLVLFSFLVAYAVIGYYRNKKFATKLALAAEPVLEDHFAYVERDPNLLDVKGWSQFEMYASGRTSCKGFLIKLDLLKRQCFWHENVIRFIQTQEDIVTFDVLFESLDNFIFAVCTKVKNKAFVTSYPHLLTFTNVYEFKELPDFLRAYLDTTDKTLVQFANYLLHQLQQFLHNLVHIYISDVDSVDTTINKKARLQCRFKLTKNYEDFEKLTKTVVHIADCAKNFSLTPKARDSILKERSELELAYNKMNKANRDDTDDEETELTSDKVKKYEEKMARKNKPITNMRIRKIK